MGERCVRRGPKHGTLVSPVTEGRTHADASAAAVWCDEMRLLVEWKLIGFIVINRMGFLKHV